jgi:anti-sigma-K factor RskA
VNAEPHVLTGAYATHALTDGERAAFERHLEACPACDREVRELRATLARLGPAAAAAPPAALWDRVRAEAAATRQLPSSPGPTGAGRRRLGRGAAPARRAVGRRRVPPLLAAAAALLVVAVSLAALNLGLAGRAGRPEGTAGLVAAVLAAPDARRVAARPGGAGQAAVVVSPGRGRAVFEASGLAPAPAGRTYQLWVVGRAGPRPAGLVEAGGRGRVTRLLDGRVTGTEQVAMTVERRGGAAQPSSAPVLVVDLRA